MSRAQPAAATAPLHGIAFFSGCESPTPIGQKVRCDFLIANFADPDTLGVTSFSEVLHLASGDEASGNLLPFADLQFSGGAFCDVGQNICTLPPGSRIETATPISFHTVTPEDSDNTNPLVGEATLTWFDQCTSQAIGCPSGNQTEHGGLQTILVKLTSSTDTAIHNADHQVVTAVEAGTKVHDFVTVSAGTGNPTPTGTVNVDFFTNSTCSGSPASNSGDVTLVNGSVDVESFAHRLTAGPYGFVAHYNGSSTYGPSDGPCEPLLVVDASISITAGGVDEVNHSQTFTVSVLRNSGDGAGFVPAAGHPVRYALTDANGAKHAVAPNPPTTCDGTTDGNGQCTIVFSSRTAGRVVGTASVTLVLAGVTVSRDTDPTTLTRSGPGGSGRVVQTFVDANITIDPDAMVVVDQPHTFIVTVKRNVGGVAGFVNALGGTKPTVSLTGANGADVDILSNTCATVGTVGGKCRVTFTSPAAGKVIGTASVNLTVNGVSVTRDTDPNTAIPAGQGGSGRAFARFVKGVG